MGVVADDTSAWGIGMILDPAVIVDANGIADVMGTVDVDITGVTDVTGIVPISLPVSILTECAVVVVSIKCNRLRMDSSSETRCCRSRSRKC